MRRRRIRSLFVGMALLCLLLRPARGEGADDGALSRVYHHRLTRINDPQPLLADYPGFVAPVRCATRFEAPPLIEDDGGDLAVRAWRFSYNLRGIVEIPNRLRARDTAVIVVHPWGIDDGQGWRTPEPAGACDFCTPAKNAVAGRHTRDVIRPFVNGLRGKVGLVGYSLIGDEDPIRKNLYRSVTGRPTAADRAAGARELAEKLAAFRYRGEPPPAQFALSRDRPVADYFRHIPGLDAGQRYNGPGFWALPVPVTKDLDVDADDVIIYDAQGYGPLKAFLRRHGIRHVLLAGYATDMCYGHTTAGYRNLAQDFNVFLVGDATLATFPANDSPRHATNAAISFASIDHLVTQISWVRLQDPRRVGNSSASSPVAPPGYSPADRNP